MGRYYKMHFLKVFIYPKVNSSWGMQGTGCQKRYLRLIEAYDTIYKEPDLQDKGKFIF